jgi:sucrose-6-phosphate hydrolase SacC (GH32 family)
MTQSSTGREPFRPQLHFSARRNWINDPNGLVWFEGEFHLFFQYNPLGNGWGHMSWGHAVSRDLVNWTELPVALPEDDRAMIFSGSVVVDTDNRSGFSPDGRAVMVACYTACLQPGAPGSPRQTQDLAYSLDRGRTWIKYGGNPVLDLGLKDFRDPKLFWHTPTQRWVMVVVVPDEREARFYGSENLRDWLELSRFSAPFDGQGIWECPDLIELPTEDGGTVWMFKVDAFGGHPSGETGARLFFGHFDGRAFSALPEDAPRWVDHGADFYAALSFNHLPPHETKPIWLSWMSCHRYAHQTPTWPWRGAMSLPRRLHARWRDGRWHLVQTMVDTVETLRRACTKWEPQRVTAGQAIVLQLSRDAGLCAEVHVQIQELDATTQACLSLVAGPNPHTPASDPDARVVTVGYDATRSCLFIDRSRSGPPADQDAKYASRREVPCRRPSAKAPLDLRIWWDWSSVEVLTDAGEVALTEQCYPSGAYQRLEWAAMGGDAQLGSTMHWSLGSATLTSAGA